MALLSPLMGPNTWFDRVVKKQKKNMPAKLSKQSQMLTIGCKIEHENAWIAHVNKLFEIKTQ